MVDTEASGSATKRIIGWDSASEIGAAPGGWDGESPLVFLRIDRVGLVYHLFFSTDGWAWSYIGSKTMASQATNIWLFAHARATVTNRIVVGCPWIRQGTALALDPWPL